MPDLNACLYNRDLPFLRGVAAYWGLEISAKDARTYSLKLEKAILDSGLIAEIIESLPKPALEALHLLRTMDGSQPWTSFARVYGEIRPMGPAKFDREKPGIFPTSVTELLWYRGLIGRAFYQHHEGLHETAFIPHEFMQDVPPSEESTNSTPLSQMMGIAEGEVKLDAAGSDSLLDQLCWLLSALRRPDREAVLARWPLPNNTVLLELSRTVGLVERKTNLPTALAKDFLEKPREQALTWLVESWRTSTVFDELRLIPDFRCEGTWQNNPVKPRRAILDVLSEVPAGKWFDLELLIDHIGQNKPDFLRRGADYDNWIIASAQPEKGLLRGVSSWPEVEAVYLRFLILGPISWLGLLDHGVSKSASKKVFLRRSELFDGLLNQYKLPQTQFEDEKIAISSNGTIEMSTHSPRIARYQISRFCEWLEISAKRYRFRLTPGSLKEAQAQGLLTRHLLALLRKYGHPNPTLIQAILRWEEQGREAWLNRPLVLHLANPDLLKALRDSPANKFLGESLGPTVVVVKSGGEDRLLGELVRLGILADRVEDRDA